jgi:hypothetical protein
LSAALTARWSRREQWIQHNKLIIGLDDEDVLQMIITKVAGGDPAELVRAEDRGLPFADLAAGIRVRTGRVQFTCYQRVWL